MSWGWICSIRALSDFQGHIESFVAGMGMTTPFPNGSVFDFGRVYVTVVVLNDMEPLETEFWSLDEFHVLCVNSPIRRNPANARQIAARIVVPWNELSQCETSCSTMSRVIGSRSLRRFMLFTIFTPRSIRLTCPSFSKISLVYPQSI